MVTRRQFLQGVGVSLCAGNEVIRGMGAAAAPGKAPYRTLFSNDSTNVLTCTSPYHRKGEPFRPEMLLATVDETAGIGIDVHLFQPCATWVPWWQSKVYPIEEHHRWWKERFGVEIRNSVHDYLLKGGDLVADFTRRCREKGLASFVSVRLNDGHHLEHVRKTPADGNQNGNHTLCRFYDEHPEYRIGPNLDSWDDRVHNWAIPEARAYKMALITEICETQDMDGLELDYMRHPSYFQAGKTTSEERRRVMTEFVAQVRAVLDRTARGGKRRWLCVRVPCYLREYDVLGLHLPEMVEAGVDMVNLSAYYYTAQNTDVAAVRKLVPGTAVYLEMTHCAAMGRAVIRGYDNFTFRRTTPEQYATTAHQAYARGADGVSAFNFVYYREHGGPERGPFHEPPFEVFSRLRDPGWLARQPQHYFLGKAWRHSQMPRKLTAGETAEFTLDLAAPAGGWTRGGKLRIQSERPITEREWSARLNGMELKATDDTAEPCPNPYPSLLATPETARAWEVPAGALREGAAKIEITMKTGAPAELCFLDLAAA